MRSAPAGLRKWNRPLIVLVLTVLLVGVVAGLYVFLSSHDLTISLSDSSVVIQRGTTHTIMVSIVGKNTPAEAAALSVSGLPNNGDVTATFSNPNPQLVANGSTTSNMTITAGSHAQVQNSTLIVEVSAGSLSRQTNLLITVLGNTFTYNMAGSYSAGWNVTTINAREGDIITLRLTSHDVAHAFFLDYNGNMIYDVGEPLSPDTHSPTTPVVYSFMITQIGSFIYYCRYHLNMTGTLNSASP